MKPLAFRSSRCLRFGVLLACCAVWNAGWTQNPPKEAWTLEAAIETAAANNPDSRMAAHAISAARALTRQANAAFWPALQLQSTFTQTDNPIGVFGAALNQRSYSPALDFNDVPDADNLNVKGLLTVPLYAGGRNSARREEAKSNLRARRHDAEAVRSALAFEVVRSFHIILKGREFSKSADAETRAFETHVELARSRYESGAALKTEMLDMEVRLAQAQENRIRARNALRLSQRALGNLLGLEGEEAIVDENVPESIAPISLDFDNRHELDAAAEEVNAAQAGLDRARGGYLPRVNAFGSADYDRGWKFHGSGESYTAGVVFQWDLWDGRLTQGKVGEARAGLAVAEERLRKIRLAIDLETEQARIHLMEAGERLQVTAKTVRQAEESAALIRDRFNEGLALAAQLIDAETALTQARVRRAEAETDRRIAVAELRRALGLPQLPTIKKD